MTETPLLRSPRTMSNRRSTSRPVSAAVGSSMTRMSDRSESAFAISTTCWYAGPMEWTVARGSSERPKGSSSFPTSSRIFFQSMSPPGLRGSRPRKTFSATDRYGTRLSSW